MIVVRNKSRGFSWRKAFYYWIYNSIYIHKWSGLFVLIKIIRDCFWYFNVKYQKQSRIIFIIIEIVWPINSKPANLAQIHMNYVDLVSIICMYYTYIPSGRNNFNDSKKMHQNPLRGFKELSVTTFTQTRAANSIINDRDFNYLRSVYIYILLLVGKSSHLNPSIFSNPVYLAGLQTEYYVRLASTYNSTMIHH